MHEHAAQADRQRPGSGIRRFDPPSIDEHRDIPFDGDGVDPLEELWGLTQ